jgi:hypothetical protein
VSKWVSKLPGTVPQRGSGTSADRASCLGFCDRLRYSAPPGSRLISVRSAVRIGPGPLPFKAEPRTGIRCGVFAVCLNLYSPRLRSPAARRRTARYADLAPNRRRHPILRDGARLWRRGRCVILGAIRLPASCGSRPRSAGKRHPVSPGEWIRPHREPRDAAHGFPAWPPGRARAAAPPPARRVRAEPGASPSRPPSVLESPP